MGTRQPKPQQKTTINTKEFSPHHQNRRGAPRGYPKQQQPKRPPFANKRATTRDYPYSLQIETVSPNLSSP